MSFQYSETYLRNLAADQVQGDFAPFNKNDIGKIKRYIKGMLGQLSDKKNINVVADYNAYGSGFASYINVKISKKNKTDSIVKRAGNKTEEETDGLLLYISLLSPYWYFGGVRWFSTYMENQLIGGTMPFLMPQNIRAYNSMLWSEDIEHITRLFEEYRYTLLTEKEVAQTLDFEVDITTNLGDKPFTVFDCFFHWED